MSSADSVEDISHLQVASELRRLDIVQQDWSTTLNSAPKAIGILGECMITASLKKASLVHIDNSNNDGLATSLSPNLMKCAQMGTQTFVEAHTRMNEIAMNAENVGRRGGTIDKVVQRVEGKDSPAARRILSRQLAILDSAAMACTGEADKINDCFDEWNEFTNDLLFAMSVRKDGTYQEQQEKKTNIRQHRALRLSKEQEKSRATEMLQERKVNLEKAREAAGKPHNHHGIWQALFCTECQSHGSCAAANNNLDLAHAYHDSQLKALEDAEVATIRLEAQLKKLQSEDATLEEVTTILYQGIQRLQALQVEITNLLVFFKTIGQRVRFLVEKLQTEFLENVEDGDSLANHAWEDVLKEEIRTIAVRTKAHFLLIHQISLVYSEVSFSYILSGLGIVNMLGLSNSTESKESMDQKQHQLDEYKRTASVGVEALTRKKRIAIEEGIKELIHSTPKLLIDG